MKIRNSYILILRYIIITLILLFSSLNLIELIQFFKAPQIIKSNHSTNNSLLKDHKKKFSVGKNQSLVVSFRSKNDTLKRTTLDTITNAIAVQKGSDDMKRIKINDKIVDTAGKRRDHMKNKVYDKVDTANLCQTPPELTHTNLPQWMQSYFTWHHKTRCQEESKDSTTKYLIVICLDRGTNCGGIADRLKPLPYYIHYANLTNRVLLFHWEKPSKIESFLQPSQLNFTLPSWLSTKDISYAQLSGTSSHKHHLNNNKRIITAKLQTWDAGRLYYDEFVGPPYFNEIFHHLFRSIFIPVPILQSLIDDTMTSLELQPGKYVAVHVRARYPTSIIKTKDKGGTLFGDYKDSIVDWSMNAVHCAVNLYPNAPVYFASDSDEAVKYIQYESPYVTNPKSLVRIVSHNTSKELLHVDIANATKYQPSDFYPAFVDLYLIGNAKCVSFGMGGFGRFGQIMSYNHTCAYNHRKYNAKVNRCPKPSFLS